MQNDLTEDDMVFLWSDVQNDLTEDDMVFLWSDVQNDLTEDDMVFLWSDVQNDLTEDDMVFLWSDVQNDLTEDDMVFLWSDVQNEAILKAKNILTDDPVLQYFNLHKPVTLQVEASENGLGGTLMQPNDSSKLQHVGYTSSTLQRNTEKCDSQIERVLGYMQCLQQV